MLHPTKKANGEIDDVSCCDAFMHFVSIGWKVLFSLVPPPHYLGGWACFFVAIFFIGIVTAVVGEVATLMGCVMGLKPGLTAITFVAIGTSLPDTFASRTAALHSRYADEAVGNITGSNSVNVFVGLGLPWVIAAAYNANKAVPTPYVVPAKGLTVSVTMYLICSLIGLLVLICRRVGVKGELGGSTGGRFCSFAFFALLWFAYVVVSALGVYDVITDF